MKHTEEKNLEHINTRGTKEDILYSTQYRHTQPAGYCPPHLGYSETNSFSHTVTRTHKHTPQEAFLTCKEASLDTVSKIKPVFYL